MSKVILDGNGKLIGWSDLFDYSTVETLEASLELPIPNHKKFSVKIIDGRSIESSRNEEFLREYKQLERER